MFTLTCNPSLTPEDMVLKFLVQNSLVHVRVADARFQAELLEAKKEIQRLKESVCPATTPTVHKDLSLISVIPKWSGSDATVTLEELWKA